MLSARDSNVPPKPSVCRAGLAEEGAAFSAAGVEQPLWGATHGQGWMAGILMAAFLCETPTQPLLQLLWKGSLPAPLCQAFLPSPQPLPSCSQNQHRAISTSSPRNIARKRHSLKGEDWKKWQRQGLPSFEPAVALHLQ